MIRLFSAFLVLLLSLSSFAWNRQYPTNPTNVSFFDIENLASDVQRLTYLYSRDLNNYERRDVYKLLRQAREILLFADGPLRACSMQSPEVMRKAFLKINGMSMAATGLAMQQTKAVKFTQNWLENYSCDEADRFVSFVRQMRLFSGAKTGLDMNTQKSVSYTMLMASRFCGDTRFENDFRSWFALAISSSGMNLPEKEAREYAKQQMERFHFSCQF